MKNKGAALLFMLLALPSMTAFGQVMFTLGGRVLSDKRATPIEYASVRVKENGLWAICDTKGNFTIKNVPKGKVTLVVTSLGYATATLTVDVGINRNDVIVRLKDDDLSLDEVQVVAKKSGDESTTAFTIDRKTLDNQQIVNIGDITSLLPGGKVVNPTLMNDRRIALHAGSGEAGNAAFGTAIDVDGVRQSNNAAIGETLSASTRTISPSNVESVEIITGIPSVEYGDLSNGIVKINTHRGASPFVVEGSVNQHTRQVSLNKGFTLGGSGGMLNFSLEHARSFSDAASPHTAYQRNAFSVKYVNTWMRHSTPLVLELGFRGNVGGYNSKSDPDNDMDDYSKMRDNAYSGRISLRWQLGKPWITQLQLSADVSATDRLQTIYANASSPSTQPYIHATTQGYHIAEDYDSNPNADIVLGPTGYWYVKRFVDSKPLTVNVRMRYDWVREFGTLTNNLKVGAQYSYDLNGGKGVYYEDMRYAPTWRPYSYKDLPALNNLAFYAEDKVSVATGRLSSLQLTFGVREDITMISGSDYGTAQSLSPRTTARYNFIERGRGFVSRLSVYAGWGKSVKLPSFQVLYPSPSYSDRLAFSSTSDAQNRSYYAYYTFPTSAVYNKDLRWQNARQWDFGIEVSTRVATLSLSAFYTRTLSPYMATSVFTPYTYYYTGPSSLQAAMKSNNIPTADRVFSIDQNGTITVSDRTGKLQSVMLQSQRRDTYVSNTKYVNASPITRCGIDWILDFKQIRALRTQIRLDGNYYRYKGLDATEFADVPNGLNSRMSDGRPYQYIGYYKGANATSATYDANASVTNGFISRQANMNVTFTTHIPRIRLVMALRIETSLYRWKRAKSQYADGSSRGYVLEDAADIFGEPYDGKAEDKTVIVYPEAYSTWDNPSERIPYLDKLLWAKDNDRQLYNDLAQLAVRSNYPYTLNPSRISSFYSANFTVTKEIGSHISVSFYANNFFDNMKKVHNSQTDLDSALFGSSYIPRFYYGLSLRLKI